MVTQHSFLTCINDKMLLVMDEGLNQTGQRLGKCLIMFESPVMPAICYISQTLCTPPDALNINALKPKWWTERSPTKSKWLGSMHLRMSPWSQSENLLQEGGFNFGHDVITIV
jgi:hypothetical protein